MTTDAEIPAACSALIKHLQLPDSFQNMVKDIYLPLSKIILQKKVSSPLLVSINGAQGTGKSTMSAFLKYIIESETGCSVANISLDDFYLDRKSRKRLAETVHPLLQTRGVPGTHDIEQMEQVILSLREGQSCIAPCFNKASDEPFERSQWQHYEKPVEVILFEGWCNNSPVQDEDDLQHPVNVLEREEDAEGVWRQYANEKLHDYQQRIFSFTDMRVMLKAPDFESVFDWRCLQEEKLKVDSRGPDERRVMETDELERFVQHYERISRHTLEHLPALADVVLPVSDDHSILGIEMKDS